MSTDELVDLEKNADEFDQKDSVKTKTKRTWYGKKRTVVVQDLEDGVPEPRPIMLYAPVYNGLAFGMSICGYFLLHVFILLALTRNL